MCKDMNVSPLCKPDSWKLHSCQIQQLDLFYHVCLIHILGICWHECLTNTDMAMALVWVPLRSSHFCHVRHRVTEEEPKATKNVGILYSLAARDKQPSKGP